MKNHVLRIISNAQSEQSYDKCVSLYEQALSLCDQWVKDSPIDASIAKAVIFEQLAYENRTPEKRSEKWKKAIGVLEELLKNGNSNIKLLKKYCEIAVGCDQDRYCDLADQEKLEYLRNSKKNLDRCIKEESDLEGKALLLNKKSSILRYLALYEISHQSIKNRIEESIRCANLSLKYKKSGGAEFELAMSKWSIARYQKSDAKYYEKIQEAERLLLNCNKENIELRKFALARFYQQTYQYLDACKTFPCGTDEFKNKRRMLRNCNIYGESVIGLWFSDYPKEIVESHLKNAIQILEASISAGYLNARNIINLSFLIGIQQGGKSSDSLLSKITLSSEQISWEKAMKLVFQGGKEDLPLLGFVLGINQSMVWNRLGTYASVFLKNEKLAMSLYRTAVRMRSNNYVAMTNLAKLLVLKGGKKNIEEASWLISRVSNLADRRFRWWRPIMDLINKSCDQPLSKTGESIKLPSESKSYSKISEIRKTFLKVEQFDDPQKRGYALEKLFYELTKIAFGKSHSSYKTDRVAESKSQIDCYFEYDNEKYRTECKWLNKPAGHDDIIIFSDKMNVVGVSGVFISMNGFTDSAVERAKELAKEKAVLLCDGDEMKSVFLGEINIDDVILLKRLHFNQNSNPYFRVTGLIESGAL